MNILADAGDMASFGMTIIFAICVPSIGLIINIASMQKQGLNPKCALSTVLFFVGFLITGITASLSNSQAIIPYTRYYCLVAAASTHALSAGLAIWGLAEVRTRRKWPRGRQRGLWGFWANIGFLMVLATWFYLQVNRPAYHRFFD